MSFEDGMFYGAPPEIFEKAKALRRNLTNEEKKLWDYLKHSPRKGFRFRRQHPIYIYVVDFYCHKAKLVIEVDGPDHNSKQKAYLDKIRTEDLNNLGIKVLRFQNEQVNNEIEKVIATIKEHLIDEL